MIDRAYWRHGVIAYRDVTAYSQWSAAPGCENDVCIYCGADNGPLGELRVGWDCHACGGN